MEVPYVYRARVMRIYDADTLYLDIDLGCGIHLRGVNGRGEPIRLYGIDAWEVRGEEREKGLEALAFVEELCPVGTDVVIRTVLDKKGKYGRLLADVYCPVMNNKGDYYSGSLADQLVKAGHAERVEY